MISKQGEGGMKQNSFICLQGKAAESMFTLVKLKCKYINMCDYSLHYGVVFYLMILSLIYKNMRAGFVEIHQEQLLSFCGALGPGSGRVGCQTAGLLGGTGARRGANNECEQERSEQARMSKQARRNESKEQE